MSRRRDGIIHESLDELTQLEADYRGKPEAVRIRALRLLKLEPERSIEDIAAMVDFSVSAVKRWIRAYREGGVQAVIRQRSGGKTVSAAEDGLGQLKRRLVAGEFESLDTVQTWIEEYRSSLGTPRLAEHVASGTREDQRKFGAEDPEASQGLKRSIRDGLLALLSELNLTATALDWQGDIQTAVRSWFPDVDYVGVSVNMFCALTQPETYNPTMAISLRSADSHLRPLDMTSMRDDTVNLQRVLDVARESNFPFENYRTPKAFVYYVEDVAYLGCIILLRDRRKPPISDETIQQMTRLKFAFMLLFAFIVARNRANDPSQYSLIQTIGQLTSDLSLTAQETRTLQCQMMGLSYEKIADTLNISVNTVRSHMRSIYAKAGTHGHSELLARYFTIQGAFERKRRKKKDRS